MEYTKGKWDIQPIPHHYDFRTGEAYCIRDKRNCCLAVVGEVDAIFDGEESKSNAQLIAAAPAMYEALKDADLIYAEIMAQVKPELRVQVATFFTGLLNAKDKAEGK